VIRQAISCDICASEKKQTNHWFVAYEQTGELRVSGWNSRNRLRPGSKHLCGQTCLHKLVDEFMANTIATRPAAFCGEEVDVDEFLQPVQTRPEAHVGARHEARHESRPDAHSDFRSELSSDLRAAARPDPLPKRRPAPLPEARPEPRSEVRSEPGSDPGSDLSSDLRVAARPDPLPKRRPAPRPESDSEVRLEAVLNPGSTSVNFVPASTPSSTPPRRRATSKARPKSAVAKMVESYISDAGLASQSSYSDESFTANSSYGDAMPTSNPPRVSAGRTSTPVFADADEYESSARLVSPEEAIAIKRAMNTPYQAPARPAMETMSRASFESMPAPAAARAISSRVPVQEPEPFVDEVPHYASRNWRAEAWEREREREREQRSINQHGKIPARRRVN
jgi:hypothetical protein